VTDARLEIVIPHVVGAGRGEFNCRFGLPALNALRLESPPSGSGRPAVS